VKGHLEYVSIVRKTWAFRAKREQKEAPVHLVSTLSSQVTEGQVSSTVVQKPQEVDPRFEGDCSLVTLVRPDHSRHIELYETLELYSRSCLSSLSVTAIISPRESFVLSAVTGETVSVPLVRVTAGQSVLG